MDDRDTLNPSAIPTLMINWIESTLMSRANTLSIAALSLIALLIGAWELIVTRMASVHYFFGVTHLVLGVSLLGFSLGAIYARRYKSRAGLRTLLLLTIFLLPPCWWLLSRSDFAWLSALFAVPFAIFGVASTQVWEQLDRRSDRGMLYLGESAGTVLGLIWLGPILISLLPVNVIGTMGFDNHLKNLIASEGLEEHQQTTTAYATTDLIRTARTDTLYIFTDAMFLTRAVAWDGKSTAFDAEHLENLARLKRLAMSSSSLDRLLLLGAGAGFDIALGLQEGAGTIDAVEVNPETIKFARTLEGWTGGVLENTRVSLHVAEARRFMSNQQGSWDQINLALLQTSPSIGRGANHVDARVLTREAIETYLRHLNPKGVLAIIQNSPLLADRTSATVLSVIDSPAQMLQWRLPVEEQLDNPFNHLILIRNEIFDQQETTQLNHRASSIGAEAVRNWSTASPITTDDKPFLFESAFQPMVHSVTITSLAALILLLVLLKERHQGAIRLLGAAAIVGAVVLAAQVLIIYRVQAALGNPVLALSVALSATLMGAGTGAFLMHTVKGTADWGMSGLAALAGCMVLGGLGHSVVTLAQTLGPAASIFITAGFVFLCCLPLGLPFMAIMDTGKRQHSNVEGLVIACDGIGGVIGAALASITVMQHGFDALAIALIITLSVYTLLGSRR